MVSYPIIRRELSRLDISKAALFVCDLQVKFRPLIQNMETVINRSALCINVCKQLDIPLVLTEQYTKVFGPTVSELRSIIPSDSTCFEKTQFSMLTPDCINKLNDLNKGQVLIVGIESHVCVLQTVLDLLENGKQVHVITDAVSSQRKHDRMVAIGRMEKAGAVLTTSESAIFDLLKDAQGKNFKACSALLKHHNAISTWEE